MDQVEVPIFFLVGATYVRINIPESEKFVEIAKSKDKKIWISLTMVGIYSFRKKKR